MVRLEVARLLVNEQTEDHLVTLREPGGERTLSILIGPFEAAAIEEALEEEPTPRPLTHELLINALTTLDWELRYVVIDDVIGDVFHAKLVLGRDAAEQSVDARPSDAIALALRADAVLFATERVLRVAGEGPPSA